MKGVLVMNAKKSRELSRDFRANRHQDTSLNSRLKKRHSIDLRDNSAVRDFGNGYNTIKPVSHEKYFK